MSSMRQVFPSRLLLAVFGLAALMFAPLRTQAAAAPETGLWSDATAQHIAFPDARLVVNGLGWFKEQSPSLLRLPTRLKETFPPKVWNLAAAPSGVRIRFTTDSLTVAVVATGSAGSTPVHVTAIGHAGLDLYADGLYMGSVAPDTKGEIRHQWIIGKTAKPREITLYLPYGRALAIKEVVLTKGASMSPPKAYAVAQPVVYYGSSITQGIAASNPGAIYQAMLSRWTNVDFVNLGFSGNGFGEPALAEAVAELEASCYVIDYWANPPTALYRDTLPKFIEIIRAKHPTTPIIITGCYYNPSEELPGDAGARQIEKRVVGRDFVEARKKAGDKFITYVDGLEMLSKEEADGLVDGRHANSMGFYFCARGLEPHLRAALGLPPGPVRR